MFWCGQCSGHWTITNILCCWPHWTQTSYKILLIWAAFLNLFISVSVVAHSMSSSIEISGYCAKYCKHQTREHRDWTGAVSNPDNPFSLMLYNLCGWNIEWPSNYPGIVCVWWWWAQSLPHNCLLPGASISDSSAHNIGPSLSTGGWSVRTATVSTCRLM